MVVWSEYVQCSTGTDWNIGSDHKKVKVIKSQPPDLLSW